MTLSVKQAQARKLAEVRAALARPQLIHITSRIAIHEPAPEGNTRPCRCCGSVHAFAAEEIDDGELLIERTTGRRIHSADLSPDTWAWALSLAEHHQIVYRVSRDQYPLLVDDSDRHILCAGSHRSGKTSIALLFLVREWVRRGGKLRRFWIVGENHEKAHILLKQIFEGDGLAPRILPPELAVKRPATHKAADLNTIMVDGSIIQLRRFNSDPTAGNLKSRPIVCGVTDEAAEAKHRNALTALEGRCVDLKGRLFFSTSPVGGSFLKPDIVDQCDEYERMPADHPKKLAGEHVGARWRSANISLLRNPWLDPVAVKRDLVAQDQESPSFKRDWLGEWCTNRGKMWLYDDDKHTYIHEARRVLDMLPLVNKLAGCNQKRITEDVARRLFQNSYNPGYQGLRASNLAYLLGTDVNGGRRAMNTVIVEVTADATKPDDRNLWHFWVIDVKQTWKGNAYKHAHELAATSWARTWAPHVTESPYKGCGMIIDPQAIFRDPTAHMYGGNPQGIVELYGDLGFDVRAPQYKLDSITPVSHIGKKDSHAVIARLLQEGRLHVNQRCHASLIKSFHVQEVSEDGQTPEKDDVAAGPVDSLRYLVHAILYSDMSR
jgi:hypothetical protein